MSDDPQPTPRRGRPPKPRPVDPDAETVVMPAPEPAPAAPARRHPPDAGVADYGISLDEISRRSREARGLR